MQGCKFVLTCFYEICEYGCQKESRKNESNARMRKRKKESEIVGDEEGISLGESQEEWKRELDEWEKHKHNRKKERDNMLLEMHDV